jgi:hypothetical protein
MFKHLQRVTTIVLIGLVSSVVSFAHTIRGVSNPTLAVARLSSPTSSVDRPQPLGGNLALACFNVQNRSPFDARITAVGLDLPGDLSGFALVSPVGAGQIPGFPLVTLDFALLTGRTFASGNPQDGLPPSTTPTQVCISGPFPRDPADPSLFMTIETLLNYSFVRFKNVGANGEFSDVGVWEFRSVL